jgi:hypothetical protein
VTFIASLIESNDFFWDIRESRADYGVPIAEFFCGVIFKAIIERCRPSSGMLLAGKPRVSVREGITTPQYILKRIRWNFTFPVLPPNPAAPLHSKNPLAPPMGRSHCFAKSRNIWATTRFVKWVALSFFRR